MNAWVTVEFEIRRELASVRGVSICYGARSWNSPPSEKESGVSDLTEIVRKMNIARYTMKLIHPDSESQRRMLATLISEEESKAPAKQRLTG
jgi:hypothetical protein